MKWIPGHPLQGKVGLSEAPASPAEDLRTNPLQRAEASGLRKGWEDLLALPTDRSAHLPGVVALLARTATVATVHSDAAVAEAVPELPPEAVLAVAVASQAVAAEVAEDVDQSR